MNISVIGLGKLGAPLLAVLAHAGYAVIGVDTNEDVVSAINAGRAPVNEPRLQDLLTAHRGNYRATTNIQEAVQSSEVTFVIVPTPSGPAGGFTLEYIEPVMHEIGAALASKTAPHLVVITSTVMPGQTEQVAGILTDASGKAQGGTTWYLAYSPTFIALGSVIDNLQHPDYALIGAEYLQAADWLGAIYARIHSAPQVVTSWANAEIAKIAQNAYITMKITFANQLGRLCSRLPGANVDEVTRALGHDRRIGPYYLKAGTAYGGPCFPRDNAALALAYQEAGIQNAGVPSLFEVTDALNRAYIDYLTQVIEGNTPFGAVGLVGIAYKPDTSCIEESASLHLAQRLLERRRPVVVFDPLAQYEVERVLGERVIYAHNMEQMATVARTIVLMHPVRDAEFAGIELRGTTIIDPWRALTEAPNGARLVALGRVDMREAERV